jgi:hypothetical protein
MPKQRLITDNFDGVVVLKQWMHYVDGRQYIGFAGKVSILSDEQAVGLKVTGGESNWIARVQGPTSSINLLGCQIRGVHEGPVASLPSDFRSVP